MQKFIKNEPQDQTKHAYLNLALEWLDVINYLIKDQSFANNLNP